MGLLLYLAPVLLDLPLMKYTIIFQYILSFDTKKYSLVQESGCNLRRTDKSLLPLPGIRLLPLQYCTAV